jgi:hypothetical protein
MRKPTLTILAAVLLVLPTRLQAQPSNGRVLPPHSTVAGRTLGEWSAVWWKWAYAIPVDDNPLLDSTGAKSKFGDVGAIFFLAGLFNPSGNASVTRTVTIPANKFIFFPLENFVDDNVGNGCATPSSTPCPTRLTIDELRAQINGVLPGITALHASIDGQPVSDLFSHRETAPAFSYTLQLTDNLQEVVNGITTSDATGTVFPAVADGFYLMLRPLPPGQHVIDFGGTVFGTPVDVTYQVTVTTTRSVQPVILVP